MLVSDKSKTLVSVLIPVYNSEKFIRETVDSVLGQTLADFEILLLDDGSADKSSEIIKSYTDIRVKYVSRTHDFIKTLNHGIDIAKGKYIALLDHDDLMLPHRLKVQYEYMEDNPFSFKPGGFIGGAGHGHTFQDKYGNYWHIASMTISVRHSFERRLGLFPVAISARNGMYAHTAWSDYPFYIPDKKVDFNKTDLSMGWNLLSFRKPVSDSSSLPGYEPDKANDEQIETWWAAQTGKKGEWLQIDMETPVTVNAIHVNFADHHFKVFAPHPPVVYQFLIEGSADGKEWMNLVDERENKKDEPHRLFTLDKPAKLRYLRISNSKELEGCFSLSGFRIFGKGEGTAPSAVTGFRAIRDDSDRRIYRFTWDAQTGATGYILQWGTQKDKLTHSVTVYDNQYEARYFNRDSEYYFSIKAFNENGN